jgi:pimeloyl-ACP methyl ester carboxylesterase
MNVTEEGTSRFVRANGVLIHYHEAGEGPVLIMVPGTGAGASAWGQNRYNIDGLAEHFRVILYNPPPVGRSDKTLVSDAPRHGFYAGILRDFMDALGIEKAHLYGGSPGAGQVIKLALDHPDRVERLILQCVVGLGSSYFTPFPWEGARLTQVAGREPTRENVMAQIEAMVPRADRRSETLFNDRYEAAIDVETNAARGRITGPTEDLVPHLGRISQPTLVIWGIEERDVPLDYGLKLARMIPDCRLHIFGGGTGHFPQFEHPGEFNRLVTTFLSLGR